MPKIKLTFPAGTGEKLLQYGDRYSDPNEPYTRNIHRPSHTVSPVGISKTDDGLMSAANGKLNHYNLGTTDFQVGAEHIMPEQAALSRTDGLTETSAFYGNGIGQRSTGTYTEDWVTLSGVSLRWYQPYATTLSLLHWDLFFSYNNWQGVFVDSRDVEGSRKTKLDLRCVLDGEYVNYTKRRLAENLYHPVAPGYKSNNGAVGPGTDFFEGKYPDATDKSGGTKGGNPKYVFPEAHSATQLSLHHPTALSKGFHEIAVQVRVGSISGESVYVQNIGTESRDGNVRGRGYFELTAKLCLGIRNARVISFL
jgi:hypothetical protein|tara:strand:+ start:6170 stop:7096 length:927 start_codon:yes stop_codon:yes gene_type:complete